MLIGFFIPLPKGITSLCHFSISKKAVWISSCIGKSKQPQFLSEIRKTISFL